MKINVLAQRAGKTHHTLQPLRVFAPLLRTCGLELKIIHDHRAAHLTDCDLLLIVEGNFAKFFPLNQQGREGEIRFLQKIQNEECKVAWFDDSDSSGYLRTYVMPFVDCYFKSQLLVDRTHYASDSPTGILFHDYYANLLGHAKPRRRSKGAITIEKANSMQVAWNLGLSDWRLHLAPGRISRLISMLSYRVKYPYFPEVRDLVERSVHINCRLGLPEGWFPIGELRQKCLSEIKSFVEVSKCCLAAKGFLSRHEYFAELCNSMICVSPFGHGEVCYRDFECFAAGALLLKQRMDHMESWPTYYQANVTYVPFEWDFSNLHETLECILQAPDRYQEIAANGRRRFLDSINHLGGAQFVEHFKSSCVNLF
jgi:hypothetical protein